MTGAMTDRDVINHYHDLFDPGDDATASGMRFGFENVGPGWLPTLERLCARLQLIAGPEFRITSVKEKMGSLRIAFRGGNDEVQAAIADAQSEAQSTCMSCGAAGTLREVEGWWVVTCGKCATA